MQLTELQKRNVFKALANKSLFAVGQEFGFDKEYSSKSKVVGAVYSIYTEVKEDPEKFTISPDVLAMVDRGIEERKSHKGGALSTATEETQSLEEFNKQNLVVGAKMKVWVLLNEKLDYLKKNRAAFRNEKLGTLATVAAIIFDKAQIAEGKATEHIAVLSKIDDNMTTEQVIEHLLKLREATTAND